MKPELKTTLRPPVLLSPMMTHVQKHMEGLRLVQMLRLFGYSCGTVSLEGYSKHS